MSFWSDLETAVETEAKKVWSEIESLATQLKPLAIATAEEVGQIALSAVLQQAPLVLSGSVKLAAATATVINTLASQGKAVAATNAQAAVQTVFNTLSQAVGAQPAAK